MNELRIFDTLDDLMNTLAEHIVSIAKDAVKNTGRFNFVLAGGNSPKRLYSLLASEAFKDKIDWQKTYFFFGDERYVPENDPRKNYSMVNEVLFEPLKINKEQIIEIKTSEPAEIAALQYFETIQKHFGNKKLVFDFTLLGLGDNSHTASLFPHTSILSEQEATVKAVFVEEVQMERISMTAPLINQSKNIAFLVFGRDKAEAVFHILEDPTGTVDDYPARLIQLEELKINWFVDRDAVSKLTQII